MHLITRRIGDQCANRGSCYYRTTNHSARGVAIPADDVRQRRTGLLNPNKCTSRRFEPTDGTDRSRSTVPVLAASTVGKHRPKLTGEQSSRGPSVDEFVVVLDHIQRPCGDVDRVIADPFEVPYRQQEAGNVLENTFDLVG